MHHFTAFYSLQENHKPAQIQEKDHTIEEHVGWRHVGCSAFLENIIFYNLLPAYTNRVIKSPNSDLKGHSWSLSKVLDMR